MYKFFFSDRFTESLMALLYKYDIAPVRLKDEDMKKYPALKIPVDMDNLKKQCENKQKKNEPIRCDIYDEELIKL